MGKKYCNLCTQMQYLNTNQKYPPYYTNINPYQYQHMYEWGDTATTTSNKCVTAVLRQGVLQVHHHLIKQLVWQLLNIRNSWFPKPWAFHYCHLLLKLKSVPPRLQKLFWTHFDSAIITQNYFSLSSHPSSCPPAVTSGDSGQGLSCHITEKMTSLWLTFIFIPPLFWPEIWRLLKIHLTPAIQGLFYIRCEKSGNTVKAECESGAKAEQFSMWKLVKRVKKKKTVWKMFSKPDMEERQFEVPNKTL